MAWTETHTSTMKNLYGWLKGKTQDEVRETLSLYIDNFSNTDENYLLKGIRAEKELSLQSNPSAPSIQKIRSRIREITEEETREQRRRTESRHETKKNDQEEYFDVYTLGENYQNIRTRKYAMDIGDEHNGTVFRVFPYEKLWCWECIREGETIFKSTLPEHLYHVLPTKGDIGTCGWKGIDQSLKDHWYEKYPWLKNSQLLKNSPLDKTIQRTSSKLSEEKLRF